MKKLFFILILFNGILNALETKSTLNIYHEVFSSLLGDKKIIVHTHDYELREVFQHSKKILLGKNIANSTIILVSSKSDWKLLKKENVDRFNNIIIFATDYRLLQLSDKIIGAFYWKKGRSQLIFIKRRLNKYKIKLPPKYKHFIVDEL